MPLCDTPVWASRYSRVPGEADGWVSYLKGNRDFFGQLQIMTILCPQRDTLQSMSASFPVYGASLARESAHKVWSSLKLEVIAIQKQGISFNVLKLWTDISTNGSYY